MKKRLKAKLQETQRTGTFIGNFVGNFVEGRAKFDKVCD
jgi:hypothetical protein